MAKKFSTLRAGLSSQAQEKSAALTRKMVNEMPLHELRNARGLSQQDLALLLNVQQPAIAKLERGQFIMIREGTAATPDLSGAIVPVAVALEPLGRPGLPRSPGLPDSGFAHEARSPNPRSAR